MPAPAIPSGSTSATSTTTLTTTPASAAGNVARRHAGAPADRHEHEKQPVHRPAERHPRQRLVRLEVLGRGEQAHDPAAEQRQPGDDVAGDDDVPRRHGGVEAPGLAVVADRVGQRRPGELKAAHGEDDRGRELHRQREQARRGRALRAQDVGAVDDVEREDRRVGRARSGRRSAAAAPSAHLRPQPDPRRAAATTARAARPPRRRSCRRGSRARRRRADDERHRQRDGQQHVAQRRDDVRAPALLDAQQRVGDLEVRERPQPEHARSA